MNNSVYMKNTALMVVLTKMLAAEFTASACEQLLCGTAGHIGISSINSRGSREGLTGREGGADTWGRSRVQAHWQMQQGQRRHNNSDDMAAMTTEDSVDM